MPKFTFPESKKEFESKWVFQQFLPYESLVKKETPSVCPHLSRVPSVLVAAESCASLGEEQSSKAQFLLPEFCSF